MLHVRDLTVSYGAATIIDGLALDVPRGGVTTIVGPNGCGKSTLLRAVAGLIPRERGEVVLNGRNTAEMKRREIARTLAVLPQTPVAPDGLTVRDLVGRGRHPHQTWLRQTSEKDSAMVDEVMELTQVAEFAERRSSGSPAGSGSVRGSRWCSPKTPRSCFWTSRPRIWTFPTPSSYLHLFAVLPMTWGAPWSWCCTI